MYTFECLYYTYCSHLRSKSLHAFFFLKVHYCDLVKLLIKTLDKRHRTFNAIPHVFHMQQTGLSDFAVNLYLKFWGRLFKTNDVVS